MKVCMEEETQTEIKTNLIYVDNGIGSTVAYRKTTRSYDFRRNETRNQMLGYKRLRIFLSSDTHKNVVKVIIIKTTLKYKWAKPEQTNKL